MTGKHDNRHDKRGEIEMTAGKDPHLAAQVCRFP